MRSAHALQEDADIVPIDVVIPVEEGVPASLVELGHARTAQALLEVREVFHVDVAVTVENIAGAHHPRYPSPNGLVMDRTDHTQSMKAFEGAPMVVEEPTDTLQNTTDGNWMRDDGVSDRHNRGSADGGSGNIAYHDGHAGRVSLPYTQKDPQWRLKYFHADTMCVRTVGGKWVNGRQVKNSGSSGNFGLLQGAKPLRSLKPPFSTNFVRLGTVVQRIRSASVVPQS